MILKQYGGSILQLDLLLLSFFFVLPNFSTPKYGVLKVPWIWGCWWTT